MPAANHTSESYDSMAAYRRILDVLGLKSQTALAAYLGIRQPSVTYGLRKGIPATWLMVLVRRSSVNPEWVLYGDKHPKYLVPSSSPFPQQTTSEKECANDSQGACEVQEN